MPARIPLCSSCSARPNRVSPWKCRGCDSRTCATCPRSSRRMRSIRLCLRSLIGSVRGRWQCDLIGCKQAPRRSNIGGTGKSKNIKAWQVQGQGVAAGAARRGRASDDRVLSASFRCRGLHRQAGHGARRFPLLTDRCHLPPTRQLRAASFSLAWDWAPRWRVLCGHSLSPRERERMITALPLRVGGWGGKGQSSSRSAGSIFP
jgi:hypothetical protein